MVLIPTRLKGLTIYPAYGRIVLSENMTDEEVREAQKIYPDIRVVEELKKFKKKNK